MKEVRRGAANQLSADRGIPTATGLWSVLGVRTTAELTHYAIGHGLISAAEHMGTSEDFYEYA